MAWTLDRARGDLFVPVKINGKTATLLLDTGSYDTILTRDAVARLGLRTEHLLDDLDVLQGYSLEGVGGRRHFDRAWAHTLDIGTRHDSNPDFVAISATRAAGFGDGLLGMRELAGYAIDLDVPGGRVALYDPAECMPAVFAGDADVHTVDILGSVVRSGPVVRVTVNGQSILALIDSGADHSAIFAAAAAKLGIGFGRADGAQLLPASGIGLFTVASRRQKVSLGIGGLSLQRFGLEVIDQRSTGPADMLLGMDFLRRVHVVLQAGSRTVRMQAAADPLLPAG